MLLLLKVLYKKVTFLTTKYIKTMRLISRGQKHFLMRNCKEIVIQKARVTFYCFTLILLSLFTHTYQVFFLLSLWEFKNCRTYVPAVCRSKNKNSSLATSKLRFFRFEMYCVNCVVDSTIRHKLTWEGNF